MRFFSTTAFLVPLMAVAILPASAKTLSVPGHYSTIQAAVTVAKPGDTIQVSPKKGRDHAYHENVVIAISGLTLQGNNGATLDGTGTGTVIDPSYGSNGITVTANNVTVRGFTVQNYKFHISDPTGFNMASAGIALDGPSKTIISGNKLQNNSLGLYAAADEPSLINNTLSGNTQFGAYLGGTAVDFEQNTVTGNGSIDNNGTISGQGVAVTSGGFTLSYNSITGNIGDGILIVTGTGTQPDGSPLSTPATIGYNTINGNGGEGINVDDSENLTIKYNTANGNAYNGIAVYNGSNTLTISYNDMSSNLYDGFYEPNGGSAGSIFISYNSARNNVYDGIELGFGYDGIELGSGGNTVSYCLAIGNGVNTASYDAEDHTGYDLFSLANIWTHDLFGTSNPPELGREPLR